MSDKKNYGEGNTKAAKNYREDQEEFADDDLKVKAKAKQAAEALKSDEAEELEKARKASAKGETV